MSANEPNAKALGHDNAKSLVTLEAAVLGVTVTFAQALDDSQDSASLFGLSWLFLAIAIAAGVTASGLVLHGVTKNKATPAGLFLNVSFFFLVVASFMLAWAGYRALDQPEGGMDSAIDEAVDFVSSTAGVDDRSLLEVRSAREEGDTFRVSVSSPTKIYTVTVASETTKVLDYTARR